jgi:hypothetical protein
LPPETRNAFLSGGAADEAALAMAALRNQKLGFNQGVFDNYNTAPETAAAYAAARANGAITRTAASNGMIFDPTAVAGGDSMSVSPLGQADIAATNALTAKRVLEQGLVQARTANVGKGKGGGGKPADDAKARDEARKIAALAFPDDPRAQIVSNPNAFKVPGYPSQPEIFVAQAGEKAGGVLDSVRDIFRGVADASAGTPLPPAERVGQAAELAPAITRDGGGAPVPPVPGVKKGEPAPYPEGMRLRGADGLIYVVTNGVPVLAQ